MATRAVIFDLDGTLWDSFPLFASLVEAQAAVPPAQTLEYLRGGTSIVKVLKAAGLNRKRFTAALAERASGEILYDGVTDSLGELKARKVALGIFTSLPGDFVEPMLGALALPHRWVNVVHANSGVARKPHPEGIMRTLDLIGARPGGDIFYVGDQPHDAEAARRAGVSFAWAGYGYGAGKPNPTTIVLNSARDLGSL